MTLRVLSMNEKQILNILVKNETKLMTKYNELLREINRNKFNYRYSNDQTTIEKLENKFLKTRTKLDNIQKMINRYIKD